ncbi:MAG: response regulator [bacterium]
MNTPAEMLAFADALPHPVVIVDRVGVVLHANAPFIDLAGRDLEALRALTWPVLRAPILGRRAADRTWSVPIGRATLLRADGEPLPVRVDAIPIGSEAGPMHLCTVRPAPQAVQDDLDGRLDDERMRELLANLPGGVYRCSYCPRWRTFFLSERFAEICGHPSDEFLEPNGRSFLEIVEPEDVPIIKRAVRAAIRARAPYEVEFRVVRPDGEVRWVLDRGIPVAGPDGRVRWLEGAMFDITARRLAESSAAARSQFLAVMSHELRTPLNAIVGMATLLLDARLGARERDHVETIRASSDALLDVIDDVLDFSKIDAGRVEIDAEPFTVTALVDRVWTLTAPRVAGKPIELLHRVDPAVPARLVGDAVRLRQVLVNLVANAIKFTASGHVDLGVDLVGRDGDRVTLAITVADTGIGIPRERQATLFDAFQQGDRSITRDFGGTGLGLAIGQRLCVLMGGTLTVESTPGEGSTFRLTISLPVAGEDGIGVEAAMGDAIADAIASAPRPSPAHADAPHTGDGAPAARVLVVDDHPTARDRLAARLAARGLVADAAPWSDERLDGIDRYDLVLVDREMGPIAGVEVIAAIRRATGSETHPRCVLLDPPGASRLDDRGAAQLDAVIDKPVSEAALDRIVTDLDEHPRPGTAQPAPPPLPPVRVLLAEDNPVNRKVALGLLGRLGVSADVAVNGQDALDAFARDPYDLVLMDLQMPVLDGLEATRRLRARYGQRPRIVALTANATREDRARCFEAGMDDFLGKPLRAGELDAALHRVLAKAG